MKDYSQARVHITVHGRVQGVFFRDFVQKLAEQLELTGWVKNNSDGTVESVAEGYKTKLEELVKNCEKGPTWAVVTNAEIKWEKFKGEFSDFSVRY